MKLLQINTSLRTSSIGKIVNQLGDMCLANGDTSYIVFGGRRAPTNSKSQIIKSGNRLDFFWHVLIPRVFDRHGFASTRATKKLLNKIDYIYPDISFPLI